MHWTTDSSSQPLVTPLTTVAGQAFSDREDPRLEAAFQNVSRGSLFDDAQGWRDKAKTFYAHTVARKPAELRIHVQRIGLYVKTEDSGIFGALLDLFLVLADKGTALRRRMLTMSKSLLTAEDYAALLQMLEPDADSQLLQKLAAKNSMLSRGITGNTRLIEKCGVAFHDEQDALESARQQIEFGQIELAQETLETALKEDPTQVELHHALLEIYRHSRQTERILDMWQQLQGRVNPALSDWQDLLTQQKLDQDSK